MATVANKPGLDPTLPDVVIKLGGVGRRLCFDFNSSVVAEKATGLNLLTAVVSDIDATKLRGLLHAALLKENPSITVEEAGAFITPWNMGVVHAAIIAAWFGSVSEPTEKTDNEEVGSPKPKARAAKRKKAV